MATTTTLIPVMPGVRYYVMRGDSTIGTVNKAYRRDGFYADQSSVLFGTPQAAAASMEPPERYGPADPDCFDCGRTLADQTGDGKCDGKCEERRREQFDCGQL